MSRLISEDVFQVNHRHVIMKIDEVLRDVFLRHRELLKDFMDEGVRIVKDYFERKWKARLKYTSNYTTSYSEDLQGMYSVLDNWLEENRDEVQMQ